MWAKQPKSPSSFAQAGRLGVHRTASRLYLNDMAAELRSPNEVNSRVEWFVA